MHRALLAILLAFSVTLTSIASDAVPPSGQPVTAAANAAKPQQYLYVLRLVPRLHDDDAWTEPDNAAVAKHFQHLQAAAAAGRVILAGRTTESGDQTMGLVIFEAANDAEARSFMESDPSVAAGVMTATLHPYAVALQRAPRH
jgi:uncharacterized protein YciI